LTYPAAIAPGDFPEGWDPDPVEQSISGVGIDLRNCERLSIAGFERPSSFMIETHGKFKAPENCTAARGEEMPMAMIQSVIVSDPQLATYLKERFKLPINVGTIGESNETHADAVSQSTWHWAVQGDEESSLTLLNVDPEGVLNERNDRLFWDNGAGISYLDLKQMQFFPEPETYVSQGSMKAPMLFHSVSEKYLAPSNFIVDSDFSGSFKSFGDYKCTALQ
jgi:hypothetical protein